MQEQIIQLLNQTLSSDTIKTAENELSSLSESPEFIPSLISILHISDIPDVTRMAALLYAQIVVRDFWNTISQETKEIIKSSLLELILEWPVSRKKSLQHYARLLIEATISNGDIEWPELPDIITDFLSRGEENSCMVGLVLANTLCGAIKQIDSEAINEWCVSFGNNLIQILLELFSQCDNYQFLSLGFHCISRILNSNAGFDFDSLAEILVPIVDKSFLIDNFDDNEDYYALSYQSLKFSVQYLTRYVTILPPDILGKYFETASNLLVSETPLKMKCYLLKIMDEIFKNPNMWSFISDKLIDFLGNLMMPLYQLTQENLEILEENPADFISDVHKSDNKNFEDVRLSASMVVYSIHEKYDDDENDYPVVDACRLIAAETYTNYISSEEKSIEEQIILFASFQLFSTVSKDMNQLDPQLYTRFFIEISPLYDSDDPLARSAAFMLLSESTNVPKSKNFILKCLEHIVDDFPIARYYAVKAVSGLLETYEDVKEIQREFADSQVIPAMFESLFELSQKFRFSDIAKSISSLIRVFEDQILPIALEVFGSLMEYISSSSESLEETLNIITDSLDDLIELILSNQEAITQLSSTFCGDLLNALQNIENPDIFNLLLETTKKIIEKMPFELSMWAIAEMLIEKMKDEESEISITDPIEIISSFIVKDEEFESREVAHEVVTFCIEQMNSKNSNIEDLESWDILAGLAANIVMRLRTNAIQSLFEPLTIMSINHIELEIERDNMSLFQNGIVSLINAMFFTDMNAVSQIANDKFDLLFEKWLNHSMFPESIMTFIACFGQISSDSETLLRALLAVTTVIFTDIIPIDDFYEEGHNFEDFDFDEIIDLAQSSMWFDFSETLIEFSNMLNQISSSNPDLYSQLMDEIVEEWQREIPLIPTFANMLEMKQK